MARRHLGQWHADVLEQQGVWSRPLCVMVGYDDDKDDEQWVGKKYSVCVAHEHQILHFGEYLSSMLI